MAEKYMVKVKPPLPSGEEFIRAILTLRAGIPSLCSRRVTLQALLALNQVERALREAAGEELRIRDEICELTRQELERRRARLH